MSSLIFLFSCVTMCIGVNVTTSPQQMCFESLRPDHVYRCAYSNDYYSLSCPHIEHVNKGNITWYYDGVKYDYSDSSSKGYAWGSNKVNHFHPLGMELCTAGNVITPTHEGNYTCQILTTEGCYKNYTITLIVFGAKPKKVTPIVDEWDDDVLTPLERSVKLFCSARVDVRDISSTWTSTLKWYFLENGILIELSNEKPFINIFYNDELQQQKTGIIKSSLVISKVTPAHFGMYTCIAHNHLGEDSKNITVSEGVPASELYKQLMTQTVSVTFGTLLILLLSYISWKRFRIPLRLYYSHRKHVTDNDPDSKYVYDVVVIYGSSSSEWVYRELVPRIEGHYGYTCFMPHRDCPGGEILWEAVFRAVSKSRMVLVVVTESLANEPGDKWMMMQGLAQALQEHTNICAIIKEGLPRVGDLQKTLQSVHKIFYPTAKPTGKSHHKNCSSEMNVRSSTENSKVVGRIPSGVDSCSEPRRHCSETSTSPFISDSVSLDGNIHAVCKTLCDVLHVGWFKNPDLIFWCEVLLYLPRPLPSYHQRVMKA